MPSQRQNYELLPRTSDDLSPDNEFKDKPLPSLPRTWLAPAILRKTRRCASRACRPLYIFIALAVVLCWQVVFNGSYIASSAPKFAIDDSETVYIAANIIDGDLITGAWGASLRDLVKKIGKDRVYVSIYGGPTAALRQLEGRLECDRSIVSEEDDPLDIGQMPRTKLPTGENRVKRIAYLAEVRNKVLEPLYRMNRDGKKFDKVLFINDVFFEADGALRLLWGTNVNKESGKPEYKAVCAADFITSWKYYDTFATRDTEGYSIGVPLFPWFGNEGESVSRRDVLAGKEAVRVRSCWGGMVAFQGVYFSSSISVSLPDNTNHVSVESSVQPLWFRSESEPFWDSSECCLIHADIIASSLSPSPYSSNPEDPHDTGIYMNPFVRVSYSATTQKYLCLAQRFERLFALPQQIINGFAHMPRFNYRREEKEGEVVGDRLWISLNSKDDEATQIRHGVEMWGSGAAMGSRELGMELETERGLERRATLGKPKGKGYWAKEGYYVDFNRTAARGGYCGVRQLLVVKETFKEGEGNWDNLLDEVPPLDV